MKRGWAALVMILLAVAAAAGEALFLDTVTHTCVAMLNEADAHMEQNEIQEAQSLAERADHRFAAEQGALDIFLYHSEIAEVSKGLAELRRYAQTGSTAEFLAASARIKRALLFLHSSRIPRIGNVL